MIKTAVRLLICQILMLLIVSGCNLSEGDAPAPAPVPGNTPVQNVFTVSAVAGMYNNGQDIDLSFTFPANVAVTGVPSVQVNIGGNLHSANYVLGNGSNTLIFRYTVTLSDEDLNGIEVAGPINLNGGSLQFDLSGVTTDCSLSFAAAATSNVLVDAVVANISSFIAAADATYYFGDTLDFTLNFTESVYITGTPRLVLDVGGITTYANYQAGSGSSAISFRLVVGGSDVDANGVGVGSPVDVSSATIVDAGGNNAALTFLPPSLPGILVNGDIPVITNATAPANATYLLGQNLDFNITFSEVVDVQATPRLALDISGATVYADYISGTGSNTLVFRYTVTAIDEDPNGIELTASIDLNTGTIKDTALNNALLNFSAIDTTLVTIDGVVSSITSVTPPANTTYAFGQELSFTVNFSESTTIVGASSYIDLTIGGASRQALCSAGTGVSTICSYTVTAGDLDLDGITTSSPIILSGSTWKDANGNNADLTFPLPVTTAINVDGTAAIITSITPPANATYVETNNLNFIVNFDENIIVTGTPRIQISLDSGTVYANYISGTGSSALTFKYTVVLNNSDADGITLVSPLLLTSGTLKDAYGNSAILSYIAPSTSGILVDALAPMVSIDALAIINIANQLTYSATGTCSDNGQNVDVVIGSLTVTPIPTCNSGVWETGPIDVSGVADDLSLLVTANHQDPNANPATQATANILKDTLAPTITFTSTPTVFTGNVLNYVIAGHCNENSDADIDVGGATTTASCDGASFSASLNVSAVADSTDPAVADVAITADITDAAGNPSIQASATVIKDTVAPSIGIDALAVITALNEATYLVAGTCNENSVNVNLFIGTTNITPACNGTTFTSGAVDVSANTDNLALPVTADITDANGNTATQAATTVIKDTVGPAVSSVVFTTADGAYDVGSISATVTFNEVANFDNALGVPNMVLTAGVTAGPMAYASGTGSTTTTFTYTIAALDMDGVTLASPVVLNGGVITDVYGNTSSTLTFTPPTANIYVVPSGMVSWHDASQASFMTTDTACTTAVSTSGDSVACWKDKSGNGNNATQATAASQGQYSTTGINGNTVVNFDGADDFYSNALTATVRVMIVVFKSNNTAGENQLYGDYASGAHTSIMGADGTYSFNGAVGGNAGKAKYLMDNDAGYSGWLRDSTTGDSVWSNATSHISYVQMKSNGGIAVSAQDIGYDGQASDYYDGDIAEILVFNTTVMGADNTAVMDYLRLKYGI
jgi:large repetitive protein